MREVLQIPGVWRQGAACAMAQSTCTLCAGLGRKRGLGKAERVCECVYRRVFRACFREYREIRQQALESEAHLARYSVQKTGGCALGWHRPASNFVCDFELTGRRVLEGFDRQTFERYVIGQLGEGKVSCHRSLDRVRIRAGQAFAELKPYGLWPVRDYYNASGNVLFVESVPTWRWE